SPADNPLVSVIIGLEGGLASGETTNPALAPFTSDLITSSGSAKYPKETFRQILSETSTTISGGGDYRGTNMTMTSTLRNFDKAWDLLSSLVLSPEFDANEFRNIQQRRVAEVKHRWNNPEGYAFIIADSLTKLGNPILGRSTRESDVESVTIPMMQAYQKALTERSRMIVVVVGNVAPEDIKRKLQAFSKLPQGKYKPVIVPAVQSTTEPKVEIVDRKIPTTYVSGVFPGPRANDPDYWPLQIGMSHLGNIMFEEIRTKRNLSYAPQAYLTATLGATRGVVAVNSVSPDSASVIMLAELEKMRRGDFSEKDLEKSKQVFITRYYMGQMTNSSLANSLYGTQRNAGDWRRTYSIDAINAVNKASVQKAMAKYARNLQIGIVGEKGKINTPKYLFHE
ncbi:MAG: pitrilysin family protein, partial [Candidatus Kapaibacterium sp.]